MMLRLFFVSLFLIATLSGCRDDRASTSTDSWYNPPPSNVYPLTGWQILDYSQIKQVTETQQAQAEQFLLDVAILELSPQQAADLIGQDLPEKPGTKPYLVRGVFLNQGGFSVQTKGQQLLVSHASMGHSPVPMKRQSLVLQLAEMPTEVFVTCSMSE